MENTQKAVDLYLNAVKDLVATGEAAEIKKAFDLLKELDEAKKAGITNNLILLISRFNSNERDKNNDIVDRDDYRREVAKIRLSLLNTVDDIPQKLALNAQVAGLKGWDFEVPNDDQLEKIIGQVSNLYKISWLQKALKASKSVCRIVCNDGSMGTGFLIANQYLITNNHVLPTPEMAAGAVIEFNFEEDASGLLQQKYTYRLNSKDFVTNTSRELDFTRVKVLENPQAEPLSFWGFLDVSSNTIPVENSPVTIIQHPLGKEKHIALTANEVIAVQDNKVLYKTDTEPGSSGSPVFDKDWNVVALHHAGKLLKEGGMRINETGQRVSANRGIIFKYINEFLANVDGGGSANPETRPAPTPTDAVESTHHRGETPPNQPATTENPSPVGLKVLVMYERDKDKVNAAKLMTALKPLESGGKAVTFMDMHQGRTFGKQKERWEKIIDTTTFVLCMITPHFFTSRDKLFDLVKYADEKNTLIIPILVEATADYDDSFLVNLEPLPMSGTFISSLADSDASYLQISHAVKEYIESL